MISIQPKWCELIASGQKTIEVRKTSPKIETPFKCYIYETKDKKYDGISVHWENGRDFIHNGGKVIGEFVCDYIVKDVIVEYEDVFEQDGCVTLEQQKKYGQNKPPHGWHISDLKIYGKPRELGEFCRYCGDDPKCDNCEFYYHNSNENGVDEECLSPFYLHKPLKRPPQSWMYVEEV